MADYTYLFYDLMSNQLIDDFPMSNVEMVRQISATGAWSGSIRITDGNRTRVSQAVIPRRTALYTDRDGVLIYGGILWDYDYDPENRNLSLVGGGIGSYLTHRVIDHPGGLTFTGTDSLAVAQSLIGELQSSSGSNLGIIVEGGTSTGVLIDQIYEDFALTYYWEALAALASLDSGGFDFRFEARYDSSGLPQRYLVFGTPLLGSDTFIDPFQFDYPGNILRFSNPMLGSESATDVYGVGAGEGPTAYIAHTTSPDMLATGYPRLDWVENYGADADETIVNSRAEAERKSRVSPPSVSPYSVRADLEPVIGSYQPGDYGRFRVSDDPWLRGSDQIRKITGITLRPGNDQPESVEISCEAIASA